MMPPRFWGYKVTAEQLDDFRLGVSSRAHQNWVPPGSKMGNPDANLGARHRCRQNLIVLRLRRLHLKGGQNAAIPR
jgi:hypothetical protein